LSRLPQGLAFVGAGIAVLAPGGSVVAAEYLSLEAAQRAVFPEGLRFEPVTLSLTTAQRKAVDALAGPQPPRGRLSAWRVAGVSGPLGYFFADEVLGRQDFIDYAVGINSDGSLRTPEIMTYRESHGGEVQNRAWRSQFAQRRDGARLRSSIDIKNIAGATLSCEHLTSGIRYLSALWQIALNTTPQVAP
jgi:hypothetical protein